MIDYKKEYKDKLILVTGGFGFIGKSLIKKIAPFSKYIFILDNLSFSYKDIEILNFKNIRFIKGDVRDERIYKKIPKVNYIYHLGAPSSVILFNKSPNKCVDITINGFIKIINFAIENRILKFIYPSSGSIYGKEDFPFNESVVNVHPINIYGKTKLVCEYISKIYQDKLRIVGLRIFAGFGPEENHKGNIASVITLFLNKILKNKRPIIFGNGQQTRDFVWIDDIVDAIIVNTFNDFVGILNVGSGISISFNKVIEIINKALKKDIKPLYIKKPINYLENTQSDISLFTKILKRKPYNPKEKILEYAKKTAFKLKS